MPVTIENPPGLYGTEEGVVRPQSAAGRRHASRRWRGPQIAAPVTEMRYAFDESRDLKGALVAAALAADGARHARRVLDGRRCSRAAAARAGRAAARPRLRRCSRWALRARAVPTQRRAPTMPSPATRRRSRRSRRPASPMSDRRRRRRRDQPRRPDRPDALPDREDGAGARRAGRRRHRQGRTRLLPADLLADRRRRRHADARPRSPASTPTCSRAARCCSTRATSIATGIDADSASPANAAAARHPRRSQRAAAGAGAGRPRADQVLLHPAGVSRPLQRQPALGRGLARRQQRRQPPGAHRRRRHRRS